MSSNLSPRAQAILQQAKLAREGLQAVRDNHDALRHERDNLLGDLTGKATNLAEARKMIERINAELRDQDAQLIKVQEELASDRKIIERVNAELAQVRSERDDALTTCETLASALETLTAEINAIKQATEAEVAEPSSPAITQGQ